MNTRESVDQLASAIRHCQQADLILPALCLMFVAVDTLGSLIRPPNKPAQGRKDFVGWIDRFLIPGSGLPCSALELYGARCGLLHGYSASSTLATGRKVRKLCWAWGATTAEEMQALADGSGEAGRLLAVHAGQLLDAFLVGKRRFHGALAADPALAALVEERAESILVAVTA